LADDRDDGAILEDRPEELLTVGRSAARLLLAVSAFFLLLGAWSWTNRVEFVAPLGGEALMSGDLAELRIVDLGETLPMTSESEGHWILSYGFDTPEPDGTWIVDIESRIVFEARTGSPKILEFKFYPFLFEELAERDIEIRTSVGVEVASLIDGVNTISVALDGGRRQIVEVKCTRVDSPRDLGLGADERTLCAKLLEVRVEGESTFQEGV
jgi:hypothetical protein